MIAMRAALSEAAETYNYIEIGIWAVIAVVVAAISLRRRGAARTQGLIAALTLAAFGASDYAEIRTGGEWWRPWWLFAWKTVCVLTLATLLLLARRRARAKSPPQSS
jgi:hypothetical protein